MVTLASFTAIWRHRRWRSSKERDPIHGTNAGGENCAGSEYFPDSYLPEGYDPAIANDLSYEDAVLDSQVRIFMQEEYGHVEPPSGLYPQVMASVRNEYRAAKEPASCFRGKLLQDLYRALSGSTLSRLVPSGLTVAVLIVVGLLSTSELSENRQLEIMAPSVTTPVLTSERSPVFRAGEQNQPAENSAIDTAPSVPTTDVTIGEEAYTFVRGIPVNNPSAYLTSVKTTTLLRNAGPF